MHELLATIQCGKPVAIKCPNAHNTFISFDSDYVVGRDCRCGATSTVSPEIGTLLNYTCREKHENEKNPLLLKRFSCTL
jgi:hypothetical protein